MLKFLVNKKTSSSSDTEGSDAESSKYTLEELRISMEGAQKKHFGYKNLKEFQVEAVHAAFHKKDSFIVMATGMGKSLCYQIPSLMKEARNKITFVVSPLISLMKDQVDNLKRKNIPCVFLGSGQKVSNQKILSEIRSGMYCIVYCSPEYALNNKEVFRSLKHRILLIAIDEVHCMSEWGHDFRPSYRKLHELREVLSGIPFMGLTATCTQTVQDDILRTMQYNMKDCLIKRSSVNKRNLFYSVRLKTEVFNDLKDILDIPVKKCTKRTQRFVDNSSIGPYNSTLIYVSSKKECEHICNFLKSRGLLASMYHSDLSNEEKKESHEKFLKDEIQIVVATVAFGMGIDKPDIRRIIHYGFSRSLEGYVQQVGRAGRDNGEAEAILFFDMVDESKTKNLIIRENVMNKQIEKNFTRVERVISMFTDASDYAYSNLCRRKKIYEYFDEEPIITEDISIFNDQNNKGVCFHVQDVDMYLCSKCDNCVNALHVLRNHQNGTKSLQEALTTPTTIPKKYNSKEVITSTKLFEDSTDLTEELTILLECIQALGGRTGLAIICKILIKSKEAAILKKNYNELSSYGKGIHKSQKWWSSFIKVVRNDKYIKETLQSGNEMAYISIGITKKGEQFLKEKHKYIVHLPFFLKDSFVEKDGSSVNKTNKKKEMKKRFTNHFTTNESEESSKPSVDFSSFRNNNNEFIPTNDMISNYDKKETDTFTNYSSTHKVMMSNQINSQSSKVNEAADKYAYLNVDHRKTNIDKENKVKEVDQETVQLTEQQINEKIMTVLLRTRMIEARKQNIPPFQLMLDKHLKEICYMRLTSVENIRKNVYDLPPSCPTDFLQKLAVGVSGLCLLYDLKTDINLKEDTKSMSQNNFIEQHRVHPNSVNKFGDFISSFQYGNQSNNRNYNNNSPNYYNNNNNNNSFESNHKDTLRNNTYRRPEESSFDSMRNKKQSSYFSNTMEGNQNQNTYNQSQPRGNEYAHHEPKFNINNFCYKDSQEIHQNTYTSSSNNNNTYYQDKSRQGSIQHMNQMIHVDSTIAPSYENANKCVTHLTREHSNSSQHHVIPESSQMTSNNNTYNSIHNRNTNTQLKMNNDSMSYASNTNSAKVVHLNNFAYPNSEPHKESMFTKNEMKAENTQSFFNNFIHKENNVNSFNGRSTYQTQLQNNSDRNDNENHKDIFGHSTNQEFLTFRELKKRKKL